MIMGEHDIYNHREPFAIEGRKIKQIKIHPKFDPLSFENDLALLQFVSPVNYQANILPACLPEDDQDMQGRTGWVTGWGRMKEGTYLFNRAWHICNLMSRRSPSICPARDRSPYAE